MSRVIGWYSCGITSLVACKLGLLEYPELQPTRIVLGGEHPDNERFHADSEKFLGREIKKLYPPTYKDHFEVAEKTRYINGPAGARCTKELKRLTRELFSKSCDIHVFGFDYDEVDRANEYEERYGLKMYLPLIDAKLRKSECKAIVEKAGIRIPRMYELGYDHNNCIGCWKGGMGYWNKIRVDFPDVFQRAVEITDSIGRSPIKKYGLPLMLRDLPPDAGRFKEDQPSSCGPMCEIALDKIMGDWHTAVIGRHTIRFDLSKVFKHETDLC